MKKLILSAIVLGTMVTGVKAQTNTSSVWDYSKTVIASLTTATNYTLVPYATYAPANSSHKSLWGGGVLVCYNVNKYVGAVVGVDYLGEFSLLSANLALQLPYQPFPNSGNSLLRSVTVTGIGIVGIGKPFSGTSGDNISIVTDAGALIKFGTKYGVGATYGQWINAGPYSGEREHVFFTYSF